MHHPELAPRLQLVPPARILFHEHPERRRTERLMERIRQDAYLRHPPIVAEVGDGRYLLLDGANRVSALRELAYSHVPVQVVDYGDESIQLKGWHHLLIQGRALRLIERFRALEEVEVQPVNTDRLHRLLELRQVFAILVDETAAAWGLFPRHHDGPSDSFRRIAVLDRIVRCYEGQSDLERIKLAEFSSLPQVIRSVEHQLILFPGLIKEELLELARARVMIPTGITRHLIPGRALALNLDLAFLAELPDEAAKESHFRRFVDRLEMEGRIRFYEESVFIMNE